MKKPLVLLTLLSGLAVMPAFASSIDPAPATLHIECITPTMCPSGVTTLVTTDSTPNLDLASEGGAVTGEAFLGILVPNGTASFSVSFGSLETNITFASGKLGDPSNLNEVGLDNYEFAAVASASSQADVTASSFTAYDWNLGAYSSSGGGSPGIATFEVGPLPLGTVIVAWIESPTGSGEAIERTPLSESLTVVATPEPATLLLFGTFLLGVGAKRRRRR